MSVQVRESGGQPQPEVKHRTLGQKECAEKIALASVFGLLIFAGAIALPTTLAHFFLGYLALKQFYVVAYWAGLQSRLRRGESVEIVTTPGVTRGYIPSFSVVMFSAIIAFIFTLGVLADQFFRRIRRRRGLGPIPERLGGLVGSAVSVAKSDAAAYHARDHSSVVGESSDDRQFR